ncbi:MAG: PilT/PilU family type 4a pilus ATPase [Planctomycetota bacterium]
MAQIDELLHKMTTEGASDLHLKVGVRPRYRIDGDLIEDGDTGALAWEDLERLTTEILSPEQERHYAETRELDFAYGNPNIGRFRCNYFQDWWGPAAVFRRIPSQVPTLKQLGLPEELATFAHLHRGLVLVTGSSGSGKTSTLAALIDVINENYRKHIITLEDPIEYLHEPKKAIIHQRGMHYDIVDFETGIVDSTRQDPDVLLIGELRDLPSIRQALVAAELGTLVFATLHTNSASDSVDRIIDVFPHEEQPQVRTMLSQCLAGVVCQVLVNRSESHGRLPAVEILKITPAVANLIREGKTQDIPNNIQSGRNYGMQTMDDALRDLMKQRHITPHEAWLHSRNKSNFERAAGRESAARLGLMPS